jgi:hypothetical protein
MKCMLISSGLNLHIFNKFQFKLLIYEHYGFHVCHRICSSSFADAHKHEAYSKAEQLNYDQKSEKEGTPFLTGKSREFRIDKHSKLQLRMMRI